MQREYVHLKQRAQYCNCVGVAQNPPSHKSDIKTASARSHATDRRKSELTFAMTCAAGKRDSLPPGGGDRLGPTQDDRDSGSRERLLSEPNPIFFIESNRATGGGPLGVFGEIAATDQCLFSFRGPAPFPAFPSGWIRLSRADGPANPDPGRQGPGG